MSSTASDGDLLRLGDHYCVLTTSAADRMTAITRVVAAGLRGGDLVIVLAASTPPATVTDQLVVQTPAAAAALRSAQVRVVPASDVYLHEGQFDPVRVHDTMVRCVEEARAGGYPGLRVVADMTWTPSSSAGMHQLPDYEAAVNELALDGTAFGACLYDQPSMCPDVMRAISQAHPATVRHLPAQPLLRLRRTHRPYGLTLVGEADASNRRAVRSALDAVVNGLPDPRDPLVVDLTGLRFADAATGAALGALGRRVPGGVHLVGCQGSVAVLLDEMKVALLPGIELGRGGASPLAR